jgi:ABC-type transport system involved in cytochrome c biogenesis permease subunit
MRQKLRFLAATVAVIMLGSAAATAAEPQSAGKWDAATLDTFRSLPVQEGGRVKPLDTYASFLLLRLNGKRTFTQTLDSGTKISLSPMEWFLDCLFFPEAASGYRHFIVDNADYVTGLGAKAPGAGQRNRFSYDDLLPARQELFNRAKAAAQVEQSKRSSQQAMLVTLEQAVEEFESVAHYFDFAHTPFDASKSRLAQKIFPGEAASGLTLSRALAHGRDLRLAFAALDQLGKEGGGDQKVAGESAAFGEFMAPLSAAFGSTGLSLIPPSDKAQKEWLSVGTLARKAFQVEQQDASELALLAALEKLPSATGSALQFKQVAGEFQQLSVSRAKERGEYNKIPLEISFYKAKFFSYAQVFFVLSFIIAALSWLNLRSRVLGWATATAVAVPWALLVTGIVYRCIIRGRPPISTLYETILFITAVSVFVALFIETVNRRRVAVSVASFLGSLGMFVAGRYEITNAEDTMPMLVAVLDTNFWLATHVTIINVGYAAGMLAAGIAHVYVFSRLFGLKRGDRDFYRSLTRMVYGVTCFGLLFAFVGTVLGGIWANYSWGRFWGWDPKENGAALICLSMLASLHARMGGYLREMGVHLAAIFTGGVVAFSWWGVNLLGVGLHSYGFTSGIWTATYVFWAIQAAAIALGFFVLLRDKFSAKSAKTPRAESGPGEPLIAK